MKITAATKNNILTVLFFLWVIIAIFNVCYNTVKAVSEVKQWAFLTDQEKRYEIFGDPYNFCLFINKNTPKNAHVLFFSGDLMQYYLARYYVYPRIIINTNSKSGLKNLAKTGKFTYIVFYNSPVALKNYKKIATFSGKKNNFYGALYELK